MVLKNNGASAAADAADAAEAAEASSSMNAQIWRNRCVVGDGTRGGRPVLFLAQNRAEDAQQQLDPIYYFIFEHIF